MKYTVLIVDDEPNAREYLKALISENKELELCGTCTTGNEAIEFCKTLQPDFIFLDIQMPGKSGIATAQVLHAKKTPPIIVFTTAYDQYAIQAFEVEAIGYLLKPFSIDQFTNTVKKAIAQKETTKKAQFNDRMNQLFEKYDETSPASITEFIIYEKGLETRLDIEDIEYIVSDSEYVNLHTKSRKYLKRLTLEMLTRQLPPYFIRIHRSIIINSARMTGWSYLNNGTYSFRFSDGEKLKSSRSYQKAIQGALSDME
tara:strand:+ start:2158 stop:2928 length:771 start_codon:yes stop_codon:yes gene_type:complete